ncbi:uncharacterized protein LOC144547863 [Carex rostrata]
MTDQLPLIETHIVDYYQTLLGVPEIKGGSLHSDFWADNEKVTSLDNKLLIAPFSEEEIKHAVFSSDRSGAPGPDGLSFGFYQHFWDTVKSDINRLVQAFVDNKIDLSYLNQAVVCLLPKEKEVTNIKQYRPISLVNCSLKIISKLLTVRLEHVMDRLIDQTQAAFIRGRYILDNVVLSHELLHYCKTNREEGVVIKIDFEKAYDKGLGPCLANGYRVINCHYADDRILFLKATSTNIETALWTMYCFEAMSDIFGSKVSHLPLKYLGVPLSDKKLSTADWSCIIDKVTKKLQGWVGNLLSIGGRLTLVNSVLTAIPLYMLSLYKMPVKVRQQIDRIRRRFLWQGYKKRTVRPFTAEWMPEDLDMVPLQSLSPVLAILPPMPHVPLVPILMNA